MSNGQLLFWILLAYAIGGISWWNARGAYEEWKQWRAEERAEANRDAHRRKGAGR
ncbi:MAG TPA: hypothetical protein VHA75_09155 [Rugosimonospora sp.]|nr:hypothetical protein [Rugosimonospora sp.]